VPKASVGRGSRPLPCNLCIFAHHDTTKACRAHHSIAVFITSTCCQPLRPSEAKPHARRGKPLRRLSNIFPANRAFFRPLQSNRYRTIKSSVEALRTQPRRSEKVLGVCSPLILKLVSRLVSPPPHPVAYHHVLVGSRCGAGMKVMLSLLDEHEPSADVNQSGRSYVDHLVA